MDKQNAIFIFTSKAQWDAIATTIPCPSEWYIKTGYYEFWGTDGKFITTLTETYAIVEHPNNSNMYLCDKF